jgi:hypothetical protein
VGVVPRVSVGWLHRSLDRCGRLPIHVVAWIDVFNTATHALLVSFTAKGKSALHPLSSENDIDAAIREAVDEIIKELES